MNRLKTIVLFAGIFAIGLGAVSLNDSSATSLSILAATPQIQTQNEVGMLGHVEYKIMDSEGQIIKYAQGDNTVVHAGMDCVSRLVFENSTSTVCPEGNNEFQFIAIGNGSAAVDPPVNTNSNLIGSQCATTATSGEMARKQVTPTFTAATGSTGTVVVLDTAAAGSTPFDFGLSNATDNITQSGVFNGPELTDDVVTGECATLGTASMFAIQNLATTTGISVSAGDSLSVKWTITVG